MTEREAFLKALAENEDDNLTRRVYADWLDEQGEHEEAGRQRQWPAAKAWLVRFCKDNNPAEEEGWDEGRFAEAEDADDWGEWVISYEDLLQIGREALGEASEEGLSCGNNTTMCDALNSHKREFWKNWSIVTGVPVSDDHADRSGFRCAC